MEKENRSEDRFPPPGVGLVQVYRIVGDNKIFVGSTLLADASSRGIGIFMDVPLQPGTKIAMSNRYADYKGIVRNCVKTDACYRMGLERTDLKNE